jgi:hypothetical protein
LGIEIVFVLIYPVALICVLAAFWFWFAVVKTEQLTIGYVGGFVPLIVGFVISMAGLALLTHTERAANFTWLVEHGYYTESQRPVYLPRRVVGQAIVNLVFVLPATCFIVIPCTMRLIRTRRLTLGAIGLRAVIGWIALSLVGWLLNLRTIVPPYELSVFLKSTVVPVLIYGLPIPLAALWFFRRKWAPVAEGPSATGG